jgi:hypothetical protein
MLTLVPIKKTWGSNLHTVKGITFRAFTSWHTWNKCIRQRVYLPSFHNDSFQKCCKYLRHFAMGSCIKSVQFTSINNAALKREVLQTSTLAVNNQFHPTVRKWWCSWWRHRAKSRTVTGSIPNGVIRIFHWHNNSSRNIALVSTQPLADMSSLQGI